jgi:pyridinium-3,5-bisthiocarboxylic acid mononucleotide nickel chelatase
MDRHAGLRRARGGKVKIAYLDCFAGISGDMFLAALVDAGVPFSILQDAVSALGLDARLEISRVNRSGIDAAKVDVLTAKGQLAEKAHAHAPVFAGNHTHELDAEGHGHTHDDEHRHDHAHEHSHDHAAHSHDHNHNHNHGHDHNHDDDHDDGSAHLHGRSLSVIQQIIRSSGLPLPVQTTALKAFDLLGRAEAKIHNVPLESIHFHEVGAVDAIADIVATAAGCHWLQIARWICSPLNVGGGHVHCAHGRFPVPAPATLELLRGLPIYASGVQEELVTPTGAALLRALDVSSSAWPAMRLSATGYGAGSRILPGQPNVLRLAIGESDAASKAGGPRSGTETKVGIIETTIDDATPELLSYIADRLLAAGASDVYRTPVQMKKGRTGTQLTILCSPARAEALQKMVFAESTTLGLRYREEQKKELARSIVPIDTPWGTIRIKIGMIDNGEIVNYAPEYEDCRLIAEKHSIPLKQVMQTAMNAYLLQENHA